MEYEIRTEGVTDFEVRMRAVSGDYRESVRRAVDAAVRAAGQHMTEHAPQGETGRLRQAVTVTDAKFEPGGAGGGGSYSAHAGVASHVAPHAKWVIEGTGEHGPFGVPIRADQFGDAPLQKQRYKKVIKGERVRINRVFAFEKAGEGTVFATTTKGQKAQTEWFVEAQRKATRVLARRLREVKFR